MKKVIALALTMLPLSAFGVTGNVLFNGTVASSCSFSSSSAGTLTVSGTSLTSATAGTIDVVNNDPGVFTLSITSTNLSTSPDGQGLSVSTVTGDVTAGPNIAIDALPASLVNAGTDTVSVEITSGTLDATATAGTYIVTTVVSCL